MADPLPPRRLGRGGLLVALLIGALLLAVLVVYASGFAYLRDEESFAELLVSHNWQDTRIATAFAELFPGKKVRFVSRSGIPIEPNCNVSTGSMSMEIDPASVEPYSERMGQPKRSRNRS